MYRSMANMLPGGYFVGGTTGWLVNQTEPEFLRHVAYAQLARAYFGSADGLPRCAGTA